MKLTIDPMDQVRKRAERRVNFHRVVSAQDLAHDHKRRLAAAVAAGGEPTPEFSRAAAIEGTSVAGLAAIILAKPDAVMACENARRALILRIRAAATAEQIAAILDEAGIGPHPADHHHGMI